MRAPVIRRTEQTVDPTATASTLSDSVPLIVATDVSSQTGLNPSTGRFSPTCNVIVLGSSPSAFAPAGRRARQPMSSAIFRMDGENQPARVLSKVMRRALGMSLHTGWAACVVVAGSAQGPEVVAIQVMLIQGDAEGVRLRGEAAMEGAIPGKGRPGAEAGVI